MKIITLANQKGGVGKTTSTYNLATAKALDGFKVLMIDLDAQGSLTIASGFEPGIKQFEGHSTIDLFSKHKDPGDAVFEVETFPEKGRLYIIPSDQNLANTENHVNTLNEKVYFVQDACEILEEYGFDYIFLDCPPNLGIMVVNALVASDEVIIPVKTDYLSYRGVQLIQESIAMVKANKRMNPRIHVAGIIPTMFRGNLSDHKDILTELESEGEILGIIKESISVARGDVDGVPVVVRAPRSEVAKEYRKIARSI